LQVQAAAMDGAGNDRDMQEQQQHHHHHHHQVTNA
jgi:hypothetical protein